MIAECEPAVILALATSALHTGRRTLVSGAGRTPLAGALGTVKNA